MTEFEKVISLLDEYNIPYDIQNLHTSKLCQYNAPCIAMLYHIQYQDMPF